LVSKRLDSNLRKNLDGTSVVGRSHLFPRVIDNYDKNYPVCLAGEGNAPPEDVGGEYGYEEFLTIMADKKHPEHDQMAAWAASQGYKDFNIEQVNRAIRYKY